MEEAVVQPQGSPSPEHLQDARQEEQPPAGVEQEPEVVGQGSVEAEEAAKGSPVPGGTPAAAADTADPRLQAVLSCLPAAELLVVEDIAEQPATAEPPRKRVRFSEAQQTGLPRSGGLAPAEQGTPALPPLPLQLARAAEKLAAAGCQSAQAQDVQIGAEGLNEDRASHLLYTLMARAEQQQQRQQQQVEQQQQRAGLPSRAPWLSRQAQYGSGAGMGQFAGQVHGTLVRTLEDASQLALQAATGAARPYALVSVNLLQTLHRAAQFAVREAQVDLEGKLGRQAARADTVANAWPPQPAAVAEAAEELRELLGEVQQVAGIARAMQPGEVPLLPIQEMLAKHTTGLQMLLSQSLRAADAALQGNGVAGAAEVWPWRQTQQAQQAQHPQLPLPAVRPPTPSPNLLDDLLPMLLAGQQVAAGQQAIVRLVAQHPQRGQEQQGQQHMPPTLPQVSQEQQEEQQQQEQQQARPPEQRQQHVPIQVHAKPQDEQEEQPVTGRSAAHYA